jgi:hypothetical protein
MLLLMMPLLLLSAPLADVASVAVFAVVCVIATEREKDIQKDC